MSNIIDDVVYLHQAFCRMSHLLKESSKEIEELKEYAARVLEKYNK